MTTANKIQQRSLRRIFNECRDRLDVNDTTAELDEFGPLGKWFAPAIEAAAHVSPGQRRGTRKSLIVAGLLGWSTLIAGCGRGEAAALREENSELRAEVERLKQQIAKSDKDHWDYAKGALSVVCDDAKDLEFFMVKAKQISQETGIAEDMALNGLARGWDRELRDRERDAFKELLREAGKKRK